MKEKSWNFSGLNVTLKRKTLLWENWRRGCEGGSEQSFEEFIQKGPVFDFNDVPRSVLREIIQELGYTETSWLAEEGKEKSIVIYIQGIPVSFADDQSLRPHNQSFQNLVKKYAMSPEEYWTTEKVFAGFLTKEVQIGKFTYKAFTELHLHENENVFIGTLAKEVTIDDIKYHPNSRIIFTKEGTIERVN